MKEQEKAMMNSTVSPLLQHALSTPPSCPSFHAASTQSPDSEVHPENLPILDAGATHCLLPASWLGAAECEMAKRIHLKVATGTTVRALLYNNVIYAKSVTRPLISVGQLKGMLGLRMLWDDSSPVIVVCYAGKKYVLLQANVVHHLPLVSRQELKVILSTIHDFTVKGELWNIHKWSEALNKTLDGLFWTNPDWSPPGTALKIEEIKEPEVMFSPLDCFFPADIDITLFSPPKSYNLEELDAETEDEEGEGEEKITTKGAQEIIMSHSLPKATPRKNVQLPAYVPEGRLSGAFTTREEGIIHATYRYPKVVKAIHHLASLRVGEAKNEGYLSAQVTKTLQVHKDKKTTAPHGS